MGFGIEERQRLRIHGLLPPRVMDADTQRDRTLAKVKSLPTQLARQVILVENISRVTGLPAVSSVL